MPHALALLRARAVAHTLFSETELEPALQRLGFVQADPICAPARAQDLILRQRVREYRAGDLERAYAAAPIEEGVLYAYGFVPRASWALLYAPDERGLGALERELLAWVRGEGIVYPETLAGRFGRARARNPWGGYSRASTLALEELRRRGLVRVAGRRRGVRGYGPAAPAALDASPEQRHRALVALVARVLAPVLEGTLRAIAARLRRRLGSALAPAALLHELCASGELARERCEGLEYLWPAAAPREGEVPRRVRFLAPFDPLVWDRRRFEHLWHWPYRFEAYTPAARRVCGYYAMPVLFGERVVGWANWQRRGARPRVELGFPDAVPRERDFLELAQAEASRLRSFLCAPAADPAAEARREGDPAAARGDGATVRRAARGGTRTAARRAERARSC